MKMNWIYCLELLSALYLPLSARANTGKAAHPQVVARRTGEDQALDRAQAPGQGQAGDRGRGPVMYGSQSG